METRNRSISALKTWLLQSASKMKNPKLLPVRPSMDREPWAQLLSDTCGAYLSSGFSSASILRQAERGAPWWKLPHWDKAAQRSTLSGVMQNLKMSDNTDKTLPFVRVFIPTLSYLFLTLSYFNTGSFLRLGCWFVCTTPQCWGNLTSAQERYLLNVVLLG